MSIQAGIETLKESKSVDSPSEIPMTTAAKSSGTFFRSDESVMYACISTTHSRAAQAQLSIDAPSFQSTAPRTSRQRYDAVSANKSSEHRTVQVVHNVAIRI